MALTDNGIILWHTGKMGGAGETTDCTPAIPMTAKKGSLSEAEGTGDLLAGLGLHAISFNCRLEDRRIASVSSSWNVRKVTQPHGLLRK